MKVVFCIIAVLFAACSAGYIDVRPGGGFGSGGKGNGLDGSQRPVLKQLRVIEEVRHNDKPISTVVKNIKLVHDEQHPKLQDVKAIHVLHQAQQPTHQAVRTIKIIHPPQQSTTQKVETIRVVHEQAASPTTKNVSTLKVIHEDGGTVTGANGDSSGGDINCYSYGAASKSGSIDDNGEHSNVDNSAGYFYGVNSGSNDDDSSAGGSDNDLKILKTLNIIGALSPVGHGSSFASYVS